MPIGRRILLAASATVIISACLDAPTSPTRLDRRGASTALHAGTTRHLSSQADCEALGGGLVGTWTGSGTTILCTVNGTGDLTAAADSLIISVPVTNLGAVTSRGYVLIDTAPPGHVGGGLPIGARPQWINSGAPARFENRGTVSSREAAVGAAYQAWTDQGGGRTDNYGRFELGVGRNQTEVGAPGFDNYGIFIHNGRLSLQQSSFVNRCGAYYQRGDFGIFGLGNDYRVAEACPNLDSQAACEALDGGLMGEWHSESICRITGTGELTAPGERLVVGGYVENHGVITNRGQLIIGSYYRQGPFGSPGSWLELVGYWETTGASARIINEGTISLVSGSLRTIGGSAAENRGAIQVLGPNSWLEVSEPGSILENYGLLRSHGSVGVYGSASLVNRCGSTFESSGPDATLFGNIVTESPCAGTTPVGSNVPVTPVDAATGQPSDISIEFGTVTGAGVTTAATGVLGTAGAPPEPPATNFRLGDPATYFDISTTATFTGAATVCIDYSGISFGNVSELRLLHYEGGAWVDITSSIDTDETLVCGLTTSFSPFVIVEANLAPVIAQVEVPADPRAVDTPVTISASFSDGNAGDSHTTTIDWGDGSSSAATVSAGGTLSGTHQYAMPGVYTVSVTVSDGGLSATRSSAVEMPAYVVVFDPTAGFVTGGGWIDSPSGACTWTSCAADGSTTGKATFGFVSRYKRGANVPDGNTEFQFVAGGLRFQSDSYDWLVVAGARAKFKGLGRIAGDVRTFAFMLTATDGALLGTGHADGFRIKIWDVATGAVVYDNQRGAPDDADAVTALGGGSVVIHR